MNNSILLSFDLEEFDIPEEYGQKIDEKIKFKISLEGATELLKVLNRLDIRATFFVTAHFAQNHKKLIKKISEKHEISSHGFYHSSFSNEDLDKSRKALEKITNKKVNGFRMPRLKKLNLSKVSAAGYTYDSSINPTYLPGRYNNFFHKRKSHKTNGLIEIPISTVPIIRFPLFWLSFKKLPLGITKILSSINLKSDKYLNIFFHPWEFSDIGDFNLPSLVRSPDGKKLLNKLESYLFWLNKKGNFVTFSEFIHLKYKEK